MKINGIPMVGYNRESHWIRDSGGFTISTKRLLLQNDLEARYRNSVSQSARNMFVLDVLQLKTRPEVHTKPR